jgi:cysteinyl-tRNA synthetase
MGEKHLGETFDIHAGGIDLMFPHHENEIAQSRGAAITGAVLPNYWMHNGFLQVEGEKMSKSLGNFFTIRELLAEKKFGGQPWHGRVLRLAMLQTHYRQPIDWTVDRLTAARPTLIDWAKLVHDVPDAAEVPAELSRGAVRRSQYAWQPCPCCMNWRVLPARAPQAGRS